MTGDLAETIAVAGWAVSITLIFVLIVVVPVTAIQVSAYLLLQAAAALCIVSALMK